MLLFQGWDKKQDKELCIIDERFAGYARYKIGEMLISFLNLDLENYSKVYDEIEQELYYNEKSEESYDNRFIDIDTFIAKDYENRLKNADKNVSEHPFVKYIDIFDDYSIPDNEEIFLGDFDLCFLQQKFKPMINFCFDINYNTVLNELTAMQRFQLWTIKNDGYYKLPVIQSRKIARYALLFPENIISILKNQTINKDTIEILKAHNFANADLIDIYELPRAETMAAIDFVQMLDNNIKVNQCEHCGKYYTLNGNYHNSKYCDSCKSEAIRANRKEKLSNSPILQEYNKAYKRYYARRTSGKMSESEFCTWATEASKKRDLYNEKYQNNHDDTIISEFKKYLGNK